MKNDTWIDLVHNLPDNIQAEVLVELLPLAEDAVRLDVAQQEGEGECEYWMVDGEIFDALVIGFPAEGEAIAADYDSHDWGEARELIIEARNRYYAES